MSAFDVVLGNMKRLGMVDANFKGTPIEKQKRPTSVPMTFLQAIPVFVKVPLDLPVAYTKAGAPRKVQPRPLRIGDRAYVKLDGKGLINIVPFERAGMGYELVKDAQEGVHFEFDLERHAAMSSTPYDQIAESRRFR